MFKLPLVALTVPAFVSVSALGADFRDFPSVFPSERVSVPEANISCQLEETPAPPGGFPGVRAVVSVTNGFMGSEGQNLMIDSQRPLRASLLLKSMARARECTTFLAEVNEGKAMAVRQGDSLILLTPGFSVFDLK